jgi:peroxisome-assembly ATPase
MQCRQQLNIQAGVKSGSKTALRSGLISPTRKPLVLPATFVAGQRRALATVQNGANMCMLGQKRC